MSLLGIGVRKTTRISPEEGPFDLIFIDADKDSYPQYLAWAIQLARPGSIIVADNCVQGGNGLRVQEDANPRYAGIRAYNQNASSNPALCSIALPINTGMTISVVLDRTEQEETDKPNFPGSKSFSGDVGIITIYRIVDTHR